MRQSRLGGDTTTPSPRTPLRGRRDDSPIEVSGNCRKGYLGRAEGDHHSHHPHKGQEGSLPILSSCETDNSIVVLGISGGYGERKVPSWHLDGENNTQFQSFSQFNEKMPQQESPSMKFQWDKLLPKPGKMNDFEHNKSGNSPSYDACARRTQVDSGQRQDSVFADVVHYPIPTENEVSTLPVYRYVDSDANNLLLPSRKMNVSIHDDEDVRIEDHQAIYNSSLAKRSTNSVYQEEDINNALKKEETRLYSKDASHCVIPTSTPTGRPFGNSAKHSSVCIAGSGGYNFRSSGVLPDPNADPYPHISHLKPSTDSDMQLEVQKKHSTVQVSPCELNERSGKLCGFVQRLQDEYDLEYIAVTHEFYAKLDRVKKDYNHDLAALSKKYNGMFGSVQCDCCYGVSLSHSPVDIGLIRKGVTENSLGEHLTDRKLCENYPSSLAHPLPKYVNAARSRSSEKPGECSDSAIMHRDGGMQDDQGGANIYSSKDSKEMDIGNSHLKKLSGEDLSFLEQPKGVKRKHDIDQISMKDNHGRNIISSETHYTESDRSVLNVTEHMYNGTGLDSNVLSGNTHSRSSSRDIKKLLGPRVPSPPQKDHDLSPPGSVRKEETLTSLQKNHHGIVHSEEGRWLSGRKHTATKFDQPENSLDFEEMVNGAFVKFLGQLNDNMELCRRLKEHGKAGRLKCSVCGSEEFLDTKSLVIHACTDPSVELRTQHFGFHKALCSLMGWKSAEVLNTRWICQMLPDVGSMFLKDDVIIWPPVVIVHNSSIDNVKRGERLLVSLQMLETMLRDGGFLEKIKVYHGRLSSQSIMVVQFNGTYSGLQEAERLHWFYANKEHGRTEFQQQMNQNSQLVNKRKTQNSPPDKVDDVLYGYLGVAEDLDKLDFEMKKRCVVRSRKEIQELANVRL